MKLLNGEWLPHPLSGPHEVNCMRENEAMGTVVDPTSVEFLDSQPVRPTGRDRSWPNRIWPSLFGRIWPNRIWPILFYRIWPNRIWPIFFCGVVGGLGRGGGPKGRGPKNSLFFFSLPPEISFFLLSLEGSSRGILVVFEASGRSNVCVWSSLVVV